MPVALRRLAAPWGRIPFLGETLRLGSDPDGDVVLEHAGLAPLHARLRQVRGAWVASAEGEATLAVNGREGTLLPLRHGDRLDLLPGAGDATAFVFEDALARAFVTPGTPRLSAWLTLPLSRQPEHGPGRLGVEVAALPEDACLVAGRDPADGAALEVAVGPGLLDGAHATRVLAGAAMLAGAPHPSLAQVRDLGLWPSPQGPRAWVATRRPAGTLALDRLAQPPAPLGTWLGWVASLARGLSWLHRRQLLHRAVGVATVTLGEQGDAVLRPTLALRAWREGLPPRPGREPTPGLRAPEESADDGPVLTAALDVHDLCGLALALRAGRWGPERAAALAAQRARPGALRALALGADLPPALEQLLGEGLAAAPARRPNANDVARRIEGWRVLEGMALP